MSVTVETEKHWYHREEVGVVGGVLPEDVMR